MDKIEKICQEIERRKSLLTQHSKLTYDLILETFIKEYDDLLSFLDTLSEEPDKSLKEAIMEYYGNIPNDKDKVDAARHFAQWQKEQMLKDAEECELYWDGDFLAIDLNMAALGYSERDKVKVIVLKAEEE